ncbi:MAG: hypothetical protein ACXV39_12250 [Halobacteriota archaeon]
MTAFTDAAQVTASASVGNSTVIYALNVKQFGNIDDASSFYAKQSFGYVPAENTTSNFTDPYTQVMGHTPTITHTAHQAVSSNMYTGISGNVVAQADEFVIYGTVTIALRA